jgi:hypothetical protein
VGTRDLKRIEVVGANIAEVLFDFRKSRPGPDGKPGLWPEKLNQLGPGRGGRGRG